MNNEIVELKINEHTETLENHGERLSTLEKKDIKHDDNIGMLCEKIDGLIKLYNKMLLAVLGGMAGVLIKILFF
ncbi:hypothetical protein [Clostridium pasteurianum]|uniref:Hemolysin XhlA n=1 Tax=Clostridium pasteurianum BC1 TaxID=86416 RepID=R4K530_CLOPA|nr:hypothetical protein [Clostridium pasteurianum]AGK96816.1 hypothetical protein Clopa_1916 [Clostridium pasteurianum BC1]